MYTLLEFKEEALADYLNSALRRHGLDTSVFNIGVAPDGKPLYAITSHKASELDLARHLIYSSHAFIEDIHPEAAAELAEIRRHNRQLFLGLFTSRRAVVFAGVVLGIAALAYLFDL